LSDAEQDRRQAAYDLRKRRIADNWRTLGRDDEGDDDDDLDEDDFDDQENDPHSAVAAVNAAYNERSKRISEAWKAPMTPYYLRPAGSADDVALATRMANLLKLSAPLPYTASAATWPVPPTAIGAPKVVPGFGQSPVTPTPTGQRTPISSQPLDALRAAADAARSARDMRLRNSWRGRDSDDPTDPDAATAIERQRERVAGRGGPL
jgi:hypothetical protein